MPIYAYRCENCGFAKDVLQKISDPLLTVCPSCGHDSFRKQVTAAGFQLKGSGWYVTDFRDKPTPAVPPVRSESDGKTADKSADKSSDKGGDGKGGEGKGDTSGKSDSAASTPSSSSGNASSASGSAPSAPAAKIDKPPSTS